MRDHDQQGALRVHAVAGTHVVLLGFDTAQAADLLGFAVEKTVLPHGTPEWLPNFLRRAENDRPGGSFRSRENPLQVFQWGDYGVEPGQRLRYRVHAVHGPPLALSDPAEVEVTTEQPGAGAHGIYFNRGVAGSQAYARKFANASPLDVPAARTWLSRGLEEALLEFIALATGPGFALRGALYEFSHPPVLRALREAAVRGADVGLVVSCPADSRFWPDHPGPANADAMREIERIAERRPFIRLATARRNTQSGIAHNKFLVLLDQGAPKAVWTGSTNITPGAIYGHSNVGHVVRDPVVADQFLSFWTQLKKDELRDPTRAWVEQNAPLPPLTMPIPHGTTTVFSPREGKAALEAYVGLIAGAAQSVFLTAPFGIGRPLETEMRTRRGKARYVLIDKPGNDMELLRADPDLQITAGAFLGEPGGYRQFMEEQLTGLNQHVQFIHTKYLLVDALTDDPVLVTGSANFSDASTVDNDENMLVISGDKRVADIYLTEFMRLFTHLRFRAAVGVRESDRRAPDPHDPDVQTPRHLEEDGRWATDYFSAGTPKARERLLFSGQ